MSKKKHRNKPALRDPAPARPAPPPARPAPAGSAAPSSPSDWSSGRSIDDLSPAELHARFGTIRGVLDLPYPPGTLTVAMIVKNEAKNIRAAVESFRPIADEIVVYDTGSNDGTQGILEELGVKWKQGEWRDDFAWARNRSIEMATSSWVIWMDADDRIPEDQHGNFRKLKTAPLDRVFGFQVINTQGGHALGARFMQLRMFPNHPDMRFRYRIHEQMHHGVAKLGLHPFFTETTIHHTGYEDPDLKKRKARRNLDILKTETERLRTEPAMSMSVGDSHYILGEWEEGIEAYKRTMDMPDCEKINRDIWREMPTCIGQGYEGLGRREEAIRWFDRGIALQPDKHEPLYYKANCLMALGRASEAEPLYRKLLAMPVAHSTTTNQYDLIQIYSAYHAARFHLGRGETSQARDLLLQSTARYPQVIENLHMLGRCQAALGDPETALRTLNKAVTLNPRAIQDVHRDRLALLRVLGRRQEYDEGLHIARECFPGAAFPDWPAAPVPAGSAPASSGAAASGPAPAPVSSGAAAPGPAPLPRLSLCMIVKDEVANLPACLESAAGLADEVIIVDTGSSDGTQEAARRLGARVVQDAWHGDFSRARNRSLEEARGHWILWLDADDRLLPEDARALRRLAEGDPDADPRAYGLLVKNSGDGGRTGSVFNQIRLFPNRPSLRFRFPVHEQILPALEAAGIPVEYTAIKVLHTGYADPALARSKQVRNKAILEAQVREGRDVSPVTWFTLANACVDLGLRAEAVEHFRKAADAARATGTNPHIAAAAPARIAAALASQGRFPEALAALEPEVSGTLPSPEAILVKAQVEDAAGRPEQARPWFESLLALAESRTFVPVDFQLLKIQALQFLGKYWYARQARDLAIHLLKAALGVKEGRDFDRSDLQKAYRDHGRA